MDLTKSQIEIMALSGHMLVKGGPGSGKTTIAILKAADIAEKQLAAEQRVLFLSFARATVHRVLQAIQYEQNIPSRLQQKIEVDTYHSFFWRVLKTHGYLLGLPRSLTIMTPPEAAIALSAIRSEYPRKPTETQKKERRSREVEEQHRLAKAEGRICFDLFAEYVAAILSGSARIRALISNRYPIIILDEFQDTNDNQWLVMKQLGLGCVLHALADPEQRIYGWIGADPKRLDHFIDAFAPHCKDLRDENHRSHGTEITLFANDILAGRFRQTTYLGIECKLFEPFEPKAFTTLVTEIYAARKRLFSGNKRDWSLAVLVPTKKMMESVSDVLHAPPGNMSPVRHSAHIDMEGPILSAFIVAHLMQPRTTPNHANEFIRLLCDFYVGRNGDEVNKTDLKASKDIEKAFKEIRERAAAGKPIRSNSILIQTLAAYEAAGRLKLIGDPDKDWLTIRDLLHKGGCSRLHDVAHEVRNVRLLERGTALRQGLAQDWRDYGEYRNALDIVRSAFVQEHFATNVKPEVGVVIMNMHKAKGKQFDEVIIFEGWPRRVKREIVANPNRIVQGNDPANASDETRQNLRVAVTRARHKTLILTPHGDPCILLLNRSRK